ncbi:MAG: hypothetical protein AB7P14_05710 [Blastocatellales bacterium]
MNRRAEWSWLDKVPALAGGQSPACWQRQLAKMTGRQSLLQKACSWIEPLNTVKIKLRRGPLLGSCLSELAAGQAKLAEGLSNDIPDENDFKRRNSGSPDQKKTKPAAAPSVRRQDGGHGNHLHSAALEPSLSEARPDKKIDRSFSQTAIKLAGLPDRVSTAFLNRFACPPSPGDQSQPNLSAVKPHRQFETGETGFQVRSVIHNKRADDKSGGSSQRPFAAMQSAAKTVRANVPSPGFVERSDSSGTFRRILDQIALRAERKIHLSLGRANGELHGQLLQNWSLPIAAPQISDDALRHWASFPQLKDRPGTRPINSGKTPAKSENDLAKNTFGNSARTEKSAFHQPSTDSPYEVLSGKGVEFWPQSLRARTPFNGPSAEAAAGELSPNSSPAIAPELPPMLPPPEVGVPILPLATSSVQRGAQEEALAMPEDLDALAAKIKFILDEQARRHGIDV